APACLHSFPTRRSSDLYWVGPHWLRIRRSDDPQVGVLARGEEIKRLRASVDVDAARAEELARTLADTRARLEALERSQVEAQARSEEHTSELQSRENLV